MVSRWNLRFPDPTASIPRLQNSLPPPTDSGSIRSFFPDDPQAAPAFDPSSVSRPPRLSGEVARVSAGEEGPCSRPCSALGMTPAGLTSSAGQGPGPPARIRI